jgi:hypothetical protein
VGTLDENYSIILRLYDSLRTHQRDVNLVLVEGIGHTMAFNGFSNEMIRCYHYLNDKGAITIDTCSDFSLLNTDTTKVLKFKITNKNGKKLSIRAFSSLTVILEKPVLEYIPDTDTVMFRLMPKPNKSGKVFIVVEAEEENGTAIEQRVIKVTVTRPGASETSVQHIDNIEVYPVPSEKNVFVKYPGEETLSVRIVSVNGMVVYENPNYFSESPIDVSSLTGGYYIIQMTGHDFQKSQSLIVQK